MSDAVKPELVRMFVNGEGMRGGRLNSGLPAAGFMGAAETAPLYRFFSVRDEFPGLFPSEDTGGGVIQGEVYLVRYDTLRDVFLPREPEELELGVIKLSDGSGSLSMLLRRTYFGSPGIQDITSYGGWRSYRGLSTP